MASPLPYKQTSLRTSLLLTFLMLAVASHGTAGADTDGTRPNILVILCDDLGYGDLQCYGHPHIQTPHLNALAESGIRLTSCYSAAPVCSPSRVGLLTGRSPNRAGVYDWIPAAGSRPKPLARDSVHMRSTETTIPQLLKRAGYATCMAGKWHCNSQFNSPEQPQPSDAGFDHWFATQNNAAPTHENPDNFVRNGEDVGSLEGFSCQLVADEFIGWLETHRQSDSDQPFFAYVAFHEPHEPVASPGDLVEQYRGVATDLDQAQYFANVTNMDLAVGRIIQTLKRLELREQTLVVFTSDNGPETLDRYPRANRSWGRATPLRGMKLWTTEAGFRVAGIVSWPATIAPHQDSDAVISSLDFLPTFCALAGTSSGPQRQLDGTDMSAIFGGGPVERERPLIWCYYNAINEQRVAMRHGEWKMLARLNGGELGKAVNVSSQNAKPVLDARLTDFELYHVTSDIDESEDLFHSAPDAAQLQRSMVKAYQDLVAGSHVWDE